MEEKEAKIEEKPKITIETSKKRRKIFRNPKFYLKRFLVNFNNLPEDADINKTIKRWNQTLIHFIINIISTGIAIHIASYFILYFTGNFHMPLKIIPILIVSYGTAWYILEETIKLLKRR